MVVPHVKWSFQVPAMAPPPSSAGGFHDSLQVSANTSLTSRSSGAVGLSVVHNVDGIETQSNELILFIQEGIIISKGSDY